MLKDTELLLKEGETGKDALISKSDILGLEVTDKTGFV